MARQEIYITIQENYIFYTHRHDTYTRIDFILVSRSIKGWIRQAEIGNILYLDHAMVSVKWKWHRKKEPVLFGRSVIICFKRNVRDLVEREIGSFSA